MSYTDTLDADDEAFGDTIQDTLNMSDSVQLREDAKFHEMSRYVCCDLSHPTPNPAPLCFTAVTRYDFAYDYSIGHAYVMTTTRIASCKSTYHILTTDARASKWS